MRVSVDGFLNHQLRIAQPVRGWRAGLDAVLLASAVAARPRDMVCEFGTGSGAAALCAVWRTRAQLVGVEKNAALADLARANAERNQLAARVEIRTLDIAARDFLAALAPLRFAHVFFNPPWYAPRRVRASPSPARQEAQLRADEPGVWVRRAASLLRAHGTLTMIDRADALADILAQLTPAFGAIRLLPVLPRAGRAAHRVLVQARLGRRAPLRLLPPLILEDAEGAPTQAAHAILRGGQALAL